jgi:hypothetical protein
MKLNRALIAAAYLVAVILILLPLIEVTLSVWPLRMNQTAWRFGTFGLISQAATTPLVGGVLLFATAFALGHRKTLLFSGVLAAVVALALLVSIPLFALDAVQMRAQVRAQTMRAFDLSSLLAIIKLSGLFALSLLLAIGAVKATRTTRIQTQPRQEPLIRT